MSKYFEWQRPSLEVRGPGEHGLGGVWEVWHGREEGGGGAGCWE